MVVILFVSQMTLQCYLPRKPGNSFVGGQQAGARFHFFLFKTIVIPAILEKDLNLESCLRDTKSRRDTTNVLILLVSSQRVQDSLILHFLPLSPHMTRGGGNLLGRLLRGWRRDGKLRLSGGSVDVSVAPAAVRDAPGGDGAVGVGDGDAGGRAGLLPPDADHPSHGDRRRQSLQGKGHPRLLPSLLRTGVAWGHWGRGWESREAL